MLVRAGLLVVVELIDDVGVASVVSSDDSNCRVEAVAKAHISELTLGIKTAKGVRACRVVQQPKNVDVGG